MSNVAPLHRREGEDEALAEALGIVIADFREAWRRDIERMESEQRAIVAEHRSAIAELRAQNAELRQQMWGAVNAEVARVTAALATIKETKDGVGIRSIERDGPRLLFELDDGRLMDAGHILGPPGDKGEPGAVGPAGKDGIPASLDLLRAVAELEVTKAMAVLPIPKDGKDGRDGIDGKDGLGFDDMQTLYDGERTMTHRYLRGEEVVREVSFKLPIVIYRGTYRDGQEYETGDQITWAGAQWIAQRPTVGEKPEEILEGKGAWILSSKRGAPGAPGKDGKDGKAGPPGPAGRDLTQIGPDGTRY